MGFHNVIRSQEGVSHWRDCCQIIMNRVSTPGTGLALTILAGWGRKFQALLCSHWGLLLLLLLLPLMPPGRLIFSYPFMYCLLCI